MLYNIVMAIIDMLSWWYTTGWGVFTRKLGNLFASLADFFSISSLLRTLFQPYRQISAGETSANASLDSKFHAFIDRLISRCVGFVSRLLIITVSGTIGIVTIVIWPLIPCLPIAGIILTCTGFML